MRDIYELIRQRETEVDSYQKEIERIHKELDALRLAAKLLDDSNGTTAQTVVPPATPAVARDVAGYSATPAARPIAVSTPATSQTPGAWASAKQFP